MSDIFYYFFFSVSLLFSCVISMALMNDSLSPLGFSSPVRSSDRRKARSAAVRWQSADAANLGCQNPGLEMLEKSWQRRRASTGGDPIWHRGSCGHKACVTEVWAQTAPGAVELSSNVKQFSSTGARSANSAIAQSCRFSRDVTCACLFWTDRVITSRPDWFCFGRARLLLPRAPCDASLSISKCDVLCAISGLRGVHVLAVSMWQHNLAM